MLILVAYLTIIYSYSSMTPCEISFHMKTKIITESMKENNEKDIQKIINSSFHIRNLDDRHIMEKIQVHFIGVLDNGKLIEDSFKLEQKVIQPDISDGKNEHRWILNNLELQRNWFNEMDSNQKLIKITFFVKFIAYINMFHLPHITFQTYKWKPSGDLGIWTNSTDLRFKVDSRQFAMIVPGILPGFCLIDDPITKCRSDN